MKRIAFFQKDFTVGGIQRALLSILDNLDYTKYKVDVYYCDKNFFYDLPQHENLKYIYFKPFPYFCRFVYFNILKGLVRFPFAGEKYDAAVDFNSYSSECALGALAVDAEKRVMWIHNDMLIKHEEEPKYRVLWHFFRKKFDYFDEFCAVSPGIIPAFRKMTGIEDKKIYSVPNFIDTSVIFKRAEESCDFTPEENEYNLCTMGRLCHQKGFDILINHMAEVLKKRNDIHLYILGDGPDREKLEQQIAGLGIGGYVSLLGNKPNPFPYLKKMDGFALTSRYEGQGIVLWEAKAMGLELFMSENLEKYNPGLKGSADIVSALINARKKEKVRDELGSYNGEIIRTLNLVLGGND